MLLVELCENWWDDDPEIAAMMKDYKDTRPIVSDFDTSEVFYRGSDKDHGVNKRDDYAVFVTNNIAQAASYAGPNGTITKMTLHPTKAFHYDYGNHFSPTTFDDHAKTMGNGQCMVVYDIIDNGYYVDLVGNKAKIKSTHITFKDGNIAKIIGTEPADKYMVQTS